MLLAHKLFNPIVSSFKAGSEFELITESGHNG
ncbi:Uncharacterised protein [Yersinia pekkanenii]|uniref:Uncharacterized protein n=1 Tax=Yersinia pekkanenii TaxID=1288385 RepID=A0A0T9PJM0_9GAMM|nr:Uncharacterised protein [Yersinia pekkanenii]CRY68137.1 Uncharacterised protein [Yersinia pekkanenii]